MSDLIRVFVGTSPDGQDAESFSVLEYTLRKHSSLPVELNFMKLSNDPTDFWYSNPEKGEGWNTSQWATPFSGFRWGIPEYCGFKGRAIYMDSDMIINNDIAKLWTQEFQPGKVIMSKGGNEGWRYCVALWDCEAAKKVLPPIKRRQIYPEFHRNMMHMFTTDPQGIVQPFQGDWNNVDGEGKKFEDIDILHYSSMNHQFHLKHAIERLKKAGRSHWFDGKVEDHPRKDLQEIFDRLLAEAIENGYPVEKYLPNDFYGDIVKESQSGYMGGNQWVTKDQKSTV